MGINTVNFQALRGLCFLSNQSIRMREQFYFDAQIRTVPENQQLPLCRKTVSHFFNFHPEFLVDWFFA